MNKKYITKASVINYLNLGYKIGNTNWNEDAWVKRYNDTVVIDEKGQYYTINSVTDDAGDYFIVSAPNSEEAIRLLHPDYDYDPEWLRKIYKFCREEEQKGRIKCNLFGKNKNGIVIVDLISGKAATAKCHPDDSFSIETGCAIAYARLRGMTPKFSPVGKMLKDLAGSIIKFNNKDYWVVPIPIVRENITYFNLIDASGISLYQDHLYTGTGGWTLSKELPDNTIIPTNDVVFIMPDKYKNIY